VRADLVRDRDTPQQAKLGAADRRRNVEGAFAVARSASPRGRRYLLVDDVTTTGATAAEAARTLKRAGAAEVCLLAAAIADLPIDPPSAG
jgi:predicted amidophosphoribosyltransferase